MRSARFPTNIKHTLRSMKRKNDWRECVMIRNKISKKNCRILMMNAETTPWHSSKIVLPMKIYLTSAYSKRRPIPTAPEILVVPFYIWNDEIMKIWMHLFLTDLIKLLDKSLTFWSKFHINFEPILRSVNYYPLNFGPFFLTF